MGASKLIIGLSPKTLWIFFAAVYLLMFATAVVARKMTVASPNIR
jgi:hypothetical protein